MNRERTFKAAVSVSSEFVARADTAVRSVEIQLEHQLADTARGPRGGLYQLVGPITHLGSGLMDDDFIMNRLTFMAKRQGYYVRPKRRAGVGA